MCPTTTPGGCTIGMWSNPHPLLSPAPPPCRGGYDPPAGWQGYTPAGGVTFPLYLRHSRCVGADIIRPRRCLRRGTFSPMGESRVGADMIRPQDGRDVSLPGALLSACAESNQRHTQGVSADSASSAQGALSLTGRPPLRTPVYGGRPIREAGANPSGARGVRLASPYWRCRPWARHRSAAGVHGPRLGCAIVVPSRIAARNSAWS